MGFADVQCNGLAGHGGGGFNDGQAGPEDLKHVKTDVEDGVDIVVINAGEGVAFGDSVGGELENQFAVQHAVGCTLCDQVGAVQGQITGRRPGPIRLQHPHGAHAPRGGA